MGLHMAFGVSGANAVLRAWVAALLVDARFVIGTIRIDFAFSACWRHWLVSWQATLDVGRTVIAWRARAKRLMVDGSANGIYAACIDAWIGAFLIEARAIRRTVIVGYAFRVRANGGAIYYTTNAVVIAWRRMAWVDFVTLWFAFDERIADSSIGARANRAVIYRFACRTIATHIWTRIHAFIVHAGLGSFAIR